MPFEQGSSASVWFEDIFVGVRFWYPLQSYRLAGCPQSQVSATVLSSHGDKWLIEFDDKSTLLVDRKRLFGIFEEYGFIL